MVEKDYFEKERAVSNCGETAGGVSGEDVPVGKRIDTSHNGSDGGSSRLVYGILCVLSFLIPLVGLVSGIVLVTRRQRRGQGVVLLVVTLIGMVFWGVLLQHYAGRHSLDSDVVNAYFELKRSFTPVGR